MSPLPLPKQAAEVDFHISAEFDLVIGTPLFTADQLRERDDMWLARLEEAVRQDRLQMEIALDYLKGMAESGALLPDAKAAFKMAADAIGPMFAAAIRESK